tara:strand:+ start:1985 stop:3013 length:1029 start_codon:yes stop_codon:yes gene_type:complete
MSRINLKRMNITLAHGGGGRASRDLIDNLLIKKFGNPDSSGLQDCSVLNLPPNSKLAFTTDSFVVNPLFFPGGNIGTLAVNGTVNDLAVIGAKPLGISCALILEEGLDLEILENVVESLALASEKANIKIITGDLKVVEKGAADKIFINTSGIGLLSDDTKIASYLATPGDKILVSGYVGDHGAAILGARGEFQLDFKIESDCKPLHGLMNEMMKVCSEIHCARDATRGGIATVLNEIAEDSGVLIKIFETKIPVREEVHGVCEILGIDPFYMANEGTLVAVVPPENSQKVLKAMKNHPCGKNSQIIGEVEETEKSRLILQTSFGTERILDIPFGDQLPRIC